MIEYNPNTKSVIFSSSTTIILEGTRKKIEKSAEMLFRTERANGRILTQAVYYKYSDDKTEGERKRPVKNELMPMNTDQVNRYVKELVEFKNGLQEAYNCYKSIVLKKELKQFEQFLVDNNCSSELLLFGIGEREFEI